MNYTNLKHEVEAYVTDLIKNPVKTIAISVLLIVIPVFFLYLSNLFVGDHEQRNTVKEIGDINSKLTPGIIPRKIEESGEHYSIEVLYPYFNIPILDQKVESIYNSEMSDFKNLEKDEGFFENFIPDYELLISFDDVVFTKDIISFSISVYRYTGGAHGNEVVIGLNYNVITGKFYSVYSVEELTGLSLEEISKKIKKSLTTKYRKLVFPDGLNPEPENFDSFLIQDNKVVFVFQKYQVMSYAHGVIRFDVQRAK